MVCTPVLVTFAKQPFSQPAVVKLRLPSATLTSLEAGKASIAVIRISVIINESPTAVVNDSLLAELAPPVKSSALCSEVEEAGATTKTVDIRAIAASERT